MTDKGAHFHKCDFQVHSTHDRAGTGNLPVTDADRLVYGRKLVAACRDRGLGAIEITDHHDLCFAKHVRLAAREELGPGGQQMDVHERLTVFPGMELTLAVPARRS